MIKKISLLLLIITITGCLSQPTADQTHTSNKGSEKNPADFLLTKSDLGTGEWVLSAENTSSQIMERRFIKVEASFGSSTKLVNRLHLYNKSPEARADFDLVSGHLKAQLPTKDPMIGEMSILWVAAGDAYLLFIRGPYAVEIEYNTPGDVDESYITGLAETLDSRIQGQ